ncbi:RDD family protein [Microbispora sp. NPDC049125]|uniref:RDD family protein n=1 Tax=Microbispora sp. NPDC049125 TaxID=3154929 RepID=UPI003466ECB4
MSEVVTGEAVVLEVRVAQLPSRAVALLIDLILQWGVLIGVYMLVTRASLVADDALSTGLLILFTVLVIVGYPVIFETVSRGRTLGKLALGLRVVGDDGGPERFRQALFRGLAGFAEFWLLFGAPALITSLVNQQGKRLGDVFAGTIVIGERGPRQIPPPQMPPQLASWAATLELSQLRDELANTARQYLSRWHQLSPQLRDEMGVRVAGQVSAVVAPPPPPGVPPHAYLAAVLAERRRREEIRLARARPFTPYGQAVPYGFGSAGAAATPGPASWSPPPRPAEPSRPPASHTPPTAPQTTPGGFVPPI